MKAIEHRVAQITVELYGVPRLKAGIPSVRVAASQVAEALQKLSELCPPLRDAIVTDGLVQPSLRLNLNGERFIDDHSTPLSDGDTLILMSADAGG